MLDDGSAPARVFIESRPGTDNKAARIEATIERYANLPPGNRINPEAFKKVEGSDGIFEFKAYQDRLFCCHTPDARVILLFAVKKQRDRHRPEDILRAESMKQEIMKFLRLNDGQKPTKKPRKR